MPYEDSQGSAASQVHSTDTAPTVSTTAPASTQHVWAYEFPLPAWKKASSIPWGNAKRMRDLEKVSKIEALGFLADHPCSRCQPDECKVLIPTSENNVIKCSRCTDLHSVCSQNDRRQELLVLEENALVAIAEKYERQIRAAWVFEGENFDNWCNVFAWNPELNLYVDHYHGFSWLVDVVGWNTSATFTWLSDY